MKFKYKKISALLLTIALISTTVFTFPITAQASSNDVTGLDNSFEYYIKNTGTGKYLDVDHGVVENGRNILEFSFNGGTNQKWQIYRLANGQYKIVSSLNTDYGLDIKSGGNAILYKYKGSSNEKFDIGRTGSGTYNIKNDNKYVSVSNSNVQTMTSYPTGTWCFERVYRGEINMFSFAYDGYSSATMNKFLQTYFDNMNYQTWYCYVNTGKNYAFDKMKMSHIWDFRGHGAPGVIAFTTDGEHFNTIEISDINSLNANALSTERVIVACACSTAVNTDGSSTATKYNNLVEAMYEKGAHCVIGFTDSINTQKASLWNKCLFQYASQGHSIYDSMTFAENQSGLTTSYYTGDTFQVLTR